MRSLPETPPSSGRPDVDPPGGGIDIPADDGAEVVDAPDEEPRVRRQSRGFFRRRGPATEREPEQPTEAIPVVPPAPGETGAADVVTVEEQPLPRGPHLRRNRAELVDEREETLFHLGGLVYDLYHRDMLTYPAAVTRARRVAEIDEAIREIDRQLTDMAEAKRARRAPAAAPPPEVGCCMACRAEFYAGARFCMQCGTRVAAPEVPGGAPPAAAPPDAGDTGVIPSTRPPA